MTPARPDTTVLLFQPCKISEDIIAVGSRIADTFVASSPALTLRTRRRSFQPQRATFVGGSNSTLAELEMWSPGGGGYGNLMINWAIVRPGSPAEPGLTASPSATVLAFNMVQRLR